MNDSSDRWAGEALLLIDHFLDGERQLRELQYLVHTLKGGLGYFDLPEILSLVEELEKCPSFDNGFHLELKLEELRLALGKLASPVAEQGSFVQVESFFKYYPDFVSRLARRLGKDVVFELRGGEVELPRGPWEKLFLPFIHVVRNSLVHGLETTSERVAVGKPGRGSVLFTFKREHCGLRIELSDDGRGIDWRKISHKFPGVRDERHAWALIEKGGISSEDSVSDLSGVGVGVAALKAAVMELGGEFQLEGPEGRGVVIRIWVPIN